ncbi:hypothetical protein PPERSA_12475 [Pseudocohnilembus persalinus]|uniref:Uncharacterized protein n=1 Tax=Pseudocohnilembus persalinus TaxID=266149 RepID=A0A0V0QPB4_PSEPJ|nr:hypothetical protein PPERSA_12475 [Pseudocohnilembus persalinus]|eukprot:KRX04028.1 hypothetical protein PPERSA_12475 [Pseudocohnilembus persalinus]
MQKPFFKIEVLLVYYEYDITNKELAQRTQKIQLPGDYSNIGYYTFYVEVSKVSEDNGWFWSSITEREYISGYTVDLQVMEPSFLNQKVQGANTDVYYSFFKFELQLKQTETIIEHPKLSEVLASFGAIFSIIMYIGLIAQMNSEAQIYGDMVNVYLKEYFNGLK